MSRLTSREVRKWIYAVAIAFVPLAVYLGWLDVEASALVLPLILAILNLPPKTEAGSGRYRAEGDVT